MTTSNRRDELLLAYRWPAAIVMSSIVLVAAAVVLAWTAVRLENPIPVSIEGGLDVERLVMPASITIRTEGPLPVTGTVGVKDQVVISGDAPLAIKGPITVRSIEAPEGGWCGDSPGGCHRTTHQRDRQGQLPRDRHGEGG